MSNDDIEYPVVLNPESIGNPDITPVVQVPDDLGDWLKDPANGGCPECTGINWFHDENCPTQGGAS